MYFQYNPGHPKQHSRDFNVRQLDILHNANTSSTVIFKSYNYKVKNNYCIVLRSSTRLLDSEIKNRVFRFKKSI